MSEVPSVSHLNQRECSKLEQRFEMEYKDYNCGPFPCISSENSEKHRGSIAKITPGRKDRGDDRKKHSCCKVQMEHAGLIYLHRSQYLLA